MARRWHKNDLKKLQSRSRVAAELAELETATGQGRLRLPEKLGPAQWFLAVDPHLRHMDCALIEWGSEEVLDVYTIKSPEGMSRVDLIEHWASQAAGKAVTTGPRLKLCVVEVPDWMNKKAGNKGVQDLVSVAMSASAFALSMSMNNVRPVLIEPRDWKGGKKKAQTDAYVKILAGAKLVPQRTNQHQRDAIWMGLSWMRQEKAGVHQ